LVGAGPPDGASRDAIGARVRVTAGGVTQTRELQSSYGHLALEHDLVMHFGLGAACTVDAIEVRWPNGALDVQTFNDVRANYRIEIRQGETAVRYLTE
jgi:hypothetical protein